MGKVIKYKLGSDYREKVSRKQRYLSKLYCFPIIGNFFKDYLKKVYGLDNSVSIIPGFHCESVNLKVGTATSLANLYIHGTGPVEIGNNSNFSRGCKIITGSHDLDDFSVAIIKPTVINDYVWVSRDSTILQGVTIGRGAVIGAKSVVRSNIPPYAIVYGNPCKVVGFRYNPEEAARFEEKHIREEDRIPMDVLQKNYNKYFTNRIKEIKRFVEI